MAKTDESKPSSRRRGLQVKDIFYRGTGRKVLPSANSGKTVKGTICMAMDKSSSGDLLTARDVMV